MRTFPLTTRRHGDIVARLTTAAFVKAPNSTAPVDTAPIDTAPINTALFLKHVLGVAQSLPEQRYAINLCANRYLFLVTFCAAIVKGQTNLLPANRQSQTVQKVRASYPDSYVIDDGAAAGKRERIVISAQMLPMEPAADPPATPQIALSHPAAIAFTSGSSGDAKANVKSWETLTVSSQINRRHMLPDSAPALSLLATVPGQHMWGLETSVLLPLFANIATCDAHPLFPQDIRDLLARLPAPRAMISSPVHLRALIRSSQEYPPVGRILCATAPLSTELAREVETRFGSEVIEVYGCTEVGSMARRQTANEQHWRMFTGLNLSEQARAGQAAEYRVDADHLPETVKLEDQLELHDDGGFSIVGRTSDMIEIAGKRGSLAQINQLIQNVEGLVDGVVLFPPQQKAVPRLVAIVVLEKPGARAALVSTLRQHVDDAFIPRPIIEVESLPRQGNGKLIKRDLLEIYERYRQER